MFWFEPPLPQENHKTPYVRKGRLTKKRQRKKTPRRPRHLLEDGVWWRCFGRWFPWRQTANSKTQSSGMPNIENIAIYIIYMIYEFHACSTYNERYWKMNDWNSVVAPSHFLRLKPKLSNTNKLCNDMRVSSVSASFCRLFGRKTDLKYTTSAYMSSLNPSRLPWSFRFHMVEVNAEKRLEISLV